jgi:hypothetical protein
LSKCSLISSTNKTSGPKSFNGEIKYMLKEKITIPKYLSED